VAEKKIYIGSFGPALYLDDELINDPDGDFSGENQQGMRCDGGGIFDGDFSIGGDLDVTGDASVTGALSVTGAITFDGKLSVGLTDWGTGATGILVDGSGYDWAAQFNARVNANLNGCCASGSYSSMALTANQTSHNSFIANWNELYIKTGLVLTDSDNYASVWGNLEIGATVTSPGSDNFVAALYGSLIVGATLTNNTRVCGVYVDSKITSTGYSGSGRTSAFECAIGAGTRAWDYGLYIPNSTVTTGIDIGTCTTDIVLKNNNTIVNTSSGLITLDASLSIGTGELTAGSINRASGSLTLEIGGAAVVTVAAALVTLAQTLALSDCVNAAADVDKFLVLDASNNVDYRTGANLLADLSGDAGAAFSWNSQNLTSVGTIGCGDITAGHGAFGGAAVDADMGIYVSVVLTDTDNSGKAALRAECQAAKTSAAMTSAGWGVYGQIILNSTNTQNWTHADAGLRAVCGYVGTESGSTGTVSNATSLFTFANIADAATITNLHGVNICTPTVAGSKVTNLYGLYICDQNAGATLNYAIYTNAGIVRLGGTLNLATCAAAGTDTDKFLVLDSGGNVDYRTGAEVLSDIGGAAVGESTTVTSPLVLTTYDISIPAATNAAAGHATAAHITALEANTDKVTCNFANVNTALAAANAAIDINSQNLTSVGTIACNEITVANGHGINLQEDITFTGASAANQIKFPDALANALSFREGANIYQQFITTDGAEVVYFAKPVGVGTTTVPHGGIGGTTNVLLAIEGPAPAWQFTNAGSDYPVMGFYTMGHDNVAIAFDAYLHDGATWKSSDAGSNYWIYKVADELWFLADSGKAQGANTGYGIAMSIEADKDVNIDSHNAATIGLKLGGTLITASAAEINLLDGASYGANDSGGVGFRAVKVPNL